MVEMPFHAAADSCHIGDRLNKGYTKRRKTPNGSWAAT
jgi:hypothetical protein